MNAFIGLKRNQLKILGVCEGPTKGSKYGTKNALNLRRGLESEERPHE